MEIHEIPSAFQSKIRIAIISALITGDKTFTELKKIVKTTDGNLSTQATNLEAEQYIKIEKTFVSNKPCTIYSLTEKGKFEFHEYVILLEKILKQ